MVYDLNKISHDMRSMADYLIPHTYPKVDVQSNSDIAILKTKNIIVDGYDISVYFSKFKFDKIINELIRINSVSSAFLPFNLVVKVGKYFLQDDRLSLLEVYDRGKKVYYWSLLRDISGNRMFLDSLGEDMQYEGFKYRYEKPSDYLYFS